MIVTPLRPIAQLASNPIGHLLDAVIFLIQAQSMSTRRAPLIISFASPKGGVGKSTSCLALAGALAARHYPVHIMDLDQNRTIADWYDELRPGIPNLTVERTAEADFLPRLEALYHQREGFILVDAAGALTNVMIQAATIAHLTITPAKLSGSDVKRAADLHHRLIEAGRYVGKGITHRILINEVAPLAPSYQRHVLAQIDRSPLQRFQTLMHTRAPYAEVQLTGHPPHFADRSRPPVQKTIDEIDALLAEIFGVLGLTQQKVAA